MMSSRQGYPARRAWAGVLVCGLLSSSPLAARQVEVVARGGLPAESWRPSPLPEEVLERARQRQLRLEAQGLLDPGRPLTEPAFIWPLRQAAGFTHHRTWATVTFVDHDPRAPGFLLDYRGGERTYDTDFGYNHQGTDSITWPFGWTKALLDQVEVVAAAPGRIVEWMDGNFDQECGPDWEEELQANLVGVAHDDGSLAFYGHLKRGSLTPKSIGDRVEQGEYLGVVASSGYSGYPHLHFEVYDGFGSLIDPFAGPFNSMNAESWWARQPRYYEPGLFEVMTHAAEPIPLACNYAERTHVANRFEPGQDVFFGVYFRDRRRGQLTRYRILDPAGRLFAKGRDRAVAEHWTISWLVLRITLPADASPGAWTVRALHRGQRLEREFEVGDFEPELGVDRVRPKTVRAASRRKLRIEGRGFHRGLVADVHAPDRLERSIRISKTRIREHRITLTLIVGADALPGRRRIVLTAPDYSQILIENAFRVRGRAGGQQTAP